MGATSDSESDTCCIEGCDRPRKTRQMCHAHYMRWFAGDRGDRLSRPLQRRQRQAERCSVDDCEKPSFSLSLCQMHYWRLKKHGTVGGAESTRRPPRACKVRGCVQPSVTRDDLCATHRRRKRLYGSPDGTYATHTVCSNDGCEAVALESRRGQKLCPEHYTLWVRRELAEGRLQGTLDPNGYRYSGILKKRYADHRLVMEHMLGRELFPFENVHHLNGRRDDNRPENLELWVKPQAVGQRLPDLIAFIVEHYREDVLAAL